MRRDLPVCGGCGKISAVSQTNIRKELTMAHTIAADKCVACGSCKDVCPAEAISEGTPFSIDADKCVDCGACAAQCPSEAISQA